MSKTRLPDSELEVMLAIWQAEGPIHTGDIVRTLSQGRDITLQSIQNYLSRLVAKEYLSLSKRGRLNYYVPRLSREAYQAMETDSFIERIYNNSAVGLVARLVKNQSLTAEEMDEIKRLLDEQGDIHG